MKVNVISINIHKNNKGDSYDTVYLSCPKPYTYEQINMIVYGNIPKIYDETLERYVINEEEYLKYLSFHGLRPINPLVNLDVNIPEDWNEIEEKPIVEEVFEVKERGCYLRPKPMATLSLEEIV